MIRKQRLELLTQRAIDGELSAEQRHELLDAIEARPGGWKHLACSFMEEHLVGSGVRQSANAIQPEIEKQTTVVPKPVSSGFWYRHPAVSTAVTICLAVALGLALPWNRGTRVQSATPATSREAQTVGIENIPSGPTENQVLREEIERLRKETRVLRQEMQTLLNVFQAQARARAADR